MKMTALPSKNNFPIDIPHAIPQFFIVGAPKCGTTALYEYLKDHPGIFLPNVKEPDYFASDFNQISQISTAEEYSNLFKNASDKQIMGEGSVFYLYSQDAIRNILETKPDAKFIAMVRNPVDMFFSLHAQFLYSFWEDEQDPEKAWALQEERQSGKNIPDLCREPKLLQYAEICALGSQLERFIEAVPEEQRLIFVLDDLKNSAADVYASSLEFLNMQHDGKTDFPVINDAKIHHNSKLAFQTRKMTQKLQPVKKALRRIFPNMSSSLLKPFYDLQSRKIIKKEQNPHFKTQLHQAFASEIKTLETLLKRDLSHWMKEQ